MHTVMQYTMQCTSHICPHLTAFFNCSTALVFLALTPSNVSYTYIVVIMCLIADPQSVVVLCDPYLYPHTAALLCHPQE